MSGKFGNLFSPLLQTRPAPPEPFGFKTGWIAVTATDPKAVADSLPLLSRNAANWHDGIEAAYRGRSVFIAPPINGWVCIVGHWAVGTGERNSVESIARNVSGLSSRFGEAQGYATNRVIEYHHWILAKKGVVLRCFAYIGESGETLCRSGAVTDAEMKLGYSSLPSERWVPDEQHVMAVASGWSFDPSKLNATSVRPPQVSLRG